MVIKTAKKDEVLDITDRVQKLIDEEEIESGVATLFVKHTTCALTIADLDPGTDKDILKALRNMLPKLEYNHPHDPEHTPDHIISAIIGPSLSIPITDGKLSLGTWQRIVLVELNGPKEREIEITLQES